MTTVKPYYTIKSDTSSKDSNRYTQIIELITGTILIITLCTTLLIIGLIL